MLNSILSGDYPRSRILTVALVVIVVALALGPFIFQGTRAFATLGLICVFIIVVASYDLMLGYTHIVSFAHVMFFGIGAYGVALALGTLGTGFGAIAIGILGALVFSGLLSLLLGLLSLRVKAIFFALVTLAVAFAFLSVVTQMYTVTGGEDGLRVRVPRELGPAFQPFGEPLTGFNLLGFLSSTVSQPGSIGAHFQDAFYDVRFSGRTLMYYVLFLVSGITFLGLLRLVNSPFGRVLKAIRENEFRAQALGYRTVLYRTAVVILAALLATLAGALFALFNRYVNPENTLNFELMVFVLLMCVLGGMGTLYGAIIGAALFILAQNYLQDLLAWINSGIEVSGFFGSLIAPHHWLLWFGLLFVISVYFFPSGIVGQLRLHAKRRQLREQDKARSAPDKTLQEKPAD